MKKCVTCVTCVTFFNDGLRKMVNICNRSAKKR